MKSKTLRATINFQLEVFWLEEKIKLLSLIKKILFRYFLIFALNFLFQSFS